MKKSILKLSFYAFILFSVGSCSSSSDDTTNEMEIPEVGESEEAVEEEAEQVEDYSSLTSAKDAMDEYKSLLEEYAETVKNGEADAANELKSKLSNLKSFAEGNFTTEDLKAMVNLSSLASQLEAGKIVNLDKAFDAYDKSLKLLQNIPINEESKKALEASKEALKGLKGLSNF